MRDVTMPLKKIYSLYIYIFNVGAIHFIYQIKKLTTTKKGSTYLSCLTNTAQLMYSVAGLERMTIGSVTKRLTLSYDEYVNA